MNASLRRLNRFSIRAAKQRAAVLALSLAICGCVVACGSHVATRGDAPPKNIPAIAFPALKTATNSYPIEQNLPPPTVHEFLAATPYKITSDPAEGDAVLRGKVLTLEAVPLLFDTKTGRATTMLVTVRCEVTLTQTDPQKVLFHTDKLVFRNEYEISTA